MLSLASGLKETDPQTSLAFLTSGPPECEALVKAEGFPCRHLGLSSMPSWNLEATEAALEGSGAGMLIVDDIGIDSRFLARMRSKAFLIVMEDGVRLGNYHANGIVNPNPNAHTLKYATDGGELLLGTEFSPIGKEFDIYQDSEKRIPERARRVLISFPGADRGAATLSAVRMLKSLKEPFIADVFVGKEFQHGEALAGETGLDDRFIFMNEGAGKARRMADADLAICPPDITFHELMMLKVPCALISSQDCPDQANIAGHAAQNGFALYLGEAGSVDQAKALQDLLGDMDARERMSARTGELVDGLGRFRLAEELLRIAGAGK